MIRNDKLIVVSPISSCHQVSGPDENMKRLTIYALWLKSTSSPLYLVCRFMYSWVVPYWLYFFLVTSPMLIFKDFKLIKVH